ncbi:MAG: histidine phosphatase family protein [Chloroflexi bacterium]|nr:histidine phosphatase family protein [Chloroflexota bacterium]
MTKLILVRHGETTWNDERRFQGHLDVPLNARGWRQAEQLGARFAGETIHAIYTSDLRRARDTAEVIASRANKPLVVEPRLREACMGELQGMTYADVHARWFPNVATMPSYFVDDAPAGVESLRELQARLVSAVNDIAARYVNETVLIVNHGAGLRALFCAWLGIELSAYWKLCSDSGSVSIVRVTEAGVVVELLNDTSHLGNDR